MSHLSDGYGKWARRHDPEMGVHTARRRQRILRAWLVLTGVTIAVMIGYSMWWRLNGVYPAARDWMGFAVLVMILGMYVSDWIRGVRRLPEDERCCACCRHAEKLPPVN